MKIVRIISACKLFLNIYPSWIYLNDFLDDFLKFMDKIEVYVHFYGHLYEFYI